VICVGDGLIGGSFVHRSRRDAHALLRERDDLVELERVVRMLLERVGPTELQFFRLFVEPTGGQVEPIVDALRSPAAGAAVLGPIAAAAGEPVTSLLDRWDSSEPWAPPRDLNERVARAVANPRGKPSGSRT
jgi:hypothetical protein